LGLADTGGGGMSGSVLVTGSIFRQPEQRMSQAELLRLNDGDGVSVQGTLRAETYEKDGSSKVGLTVMADQVLALRQPPKTRERKPSEAKSQTTDRTFDDRSRSFDDQIPF
jgi:single-stranded DNA-binding protein